MKTVTVSASRQYDILIGQGCLSEVVLRAPLKDGDRRVCVVTDDNVAPLHLSALTELLSSRGISHETLVLPHGEATKSWSKLGEMLTFLAERAFTQKDLLLAFGGGVIGDITGLCASLYLRGIEFIQVPTTLLSAVDSSVGGKCAVDLPTGKNLVGAFHQPSLVVCDTALLGTLPDAEFSNGMAEVIKYAIGFDSDLFSLCEAGVCENLEEVIRRCIEIKRDVVEKDEFDCGERKKLNLGHTPAHAIEALSSFRIPHGAAVGMGLSLMAHAFLLPDAAHSVDRVLTQYRLCTASAYSAAELAGAALADKKRCGSTLSLIVPKKIGSCDVLDVSVEDLEAIFARGVQ